MRKKIPGLILGTNTDWEKFPGEQTTEAFQLEKAGCGHALAPGSSQQLPAVCPSCQVSSLLNILGMCTTMWAKQGGPYPQDVGFTYAKRRKEWNFRKSLLVKYMCQLELWAEQEQAWAAEHPGVLEGLGKKASKIRSSGDALAMARMNMPLANTMKSDLVDGDRPKKCQGRKSVRFAEDTPENPKRFRPSFNRTQPGYSPGRWAARDGEVFLDTSFAYDEWYGRSEYEAVLDWRWNADMDGWAGYLVEMGVALHTTPSRRDWS
ncbi:hypothetical protein K505DRAFT_365036 [Melanomma pulvis-pyrius CBS 109.77]|uniref:Uncharacterized protein n=1 Tax=Melanomma pulvis-pyrius CBS 109.77 TaxID=1314802 RepID=A0A6A6X177_9PLEO|nr:hypothetical protein K505DRAFT_365036 [Melanomma pulvis-pyrius CBS 109.77]